MSAITKAVATPRFRQPAPKPIWWYAAFCPIVLAPVWLSLPLTFIGALSSFTGMLLTLLLVSSSVTDLSHRKIYNWTTYTAFAWALGINLLPALPSANMGTIGFANSCIGATACFLIMLIPYSLARGGAGDVKLAAAIGALLGLDSGLLVIAFAYILAATAIITWTIWQSGPTILPRGMFRKFGSRLFPGHVLPPSRQQDLLLNQPIPLAGFFLVATLMVVLDIPARLGAY